MNLCFQKQNLFFFFIVITVCSVIQASDDNNTEEGLIEQEKVEDLFQQATQNIVKEKSGHLKKILKKFLKDGIDKKIDDTGDNNPIDKKEITKTTTSSQLLDTMSTIGIQISRQILNDLNITDRVNARSLKILEKRQAPQALCPFLKDTECDPKDVFRSIDGSCNNLELPLIGKSSTPYKRYLTPAYDDGLETARTLSKSGKELPNPRVISRGLFKDNFQFDNDYTHIIAFFGQFITHDFTLASTSTDSKGLPRLCGCDDTNIDCLAMQMPSDENIMKLNCMKFTRSSSTFSSIDCKLGYREQLNLLTSFLDASQVYGSENFQSNNLRQKERGLLKASKGLKEKEFLPNFKDMACRDQNREHQCFKAGDSRVNNNLGLVGLHTLFLREHNRIANELEKINPDWDDERLFNESRRIVIASYQHIIFTEYLPALIGENFVRAFDLNARPMDEYYKGYNKNINPSVANEFSSAAFRFGHSLIRSQIGRYNHNNLVISPSVNISEIIFRPVEAYNEQAGGLDSLFISIINEPPSRFDTNIANHLQNHLFEIRVSASMIIAEDLAAMNINRGRDHGISSYNHFREKCGFPKATAFEDLSDLISSINIEKLKSTYEDVDDIDFYVGGLSERSINGALLGPTFSCIVALQFRDFKKGDRFFYENGPSATALSLEQLNEIKKSSLAGMICKNFDLNFIQPKVFLQPRTSIENSRIPCHAVPNIDLSKWKEE